MAHNIGPAFQLQGRFTPDFLQAASLGLISGVKPAFISANNPAVGSVSIEDVWDVGGTLVYATSGEQLEILSDSSNDTLAGTGARTVLITYLDDNYIRQTEQINLNGTTPVTTVATNILRFSEMKTIDAGTLPKENEGTITIRVAGAGNPRGAMSPTVNVTRGSHYTVPAGKKTYIAGIIEQINKNEDVSIAYRRTEGDSGIFIARAISSIYQDTNKFDFQVYIELAEKSDYKMTAISNNALASPFIFIELLEVDDS